MGATITTLGNVLKDFYLPPVVEQLNNDVLLLSRIETRSEDLFGNQAVLPLHTARTGGIGARAENATLPTSGNQGYKRLVYDLKYLYGRVEVTGPSMAKTRSETGAFLQALKSELDGIRADLKKDLARQVYNDGSAKIATCGTTTASTTVVISSREPIDKGQLYVGQVIDIGTVAAPTTIVAGATISAVNPATPSVTIGSSVTTSSSHFIFRAGSATAGASNEINGLANMVAATGAVGGLDPANAGSEFWASLTLAATAGNVSLDDFQQSFNRVRIAGGEVSAVITSFGVQRKYFNLLQSQVRYNDPMTIRGGFQTLEHMGKPIIADLDAPWGQAVFLDERFLKTFSNRDWHFLDEDGDVLKWVTDKDSWQAVLARYMNLGITRRNVQLRYTGVTDATGY